MCTAIMVHNCHPHVHSHAIKAFVAAAIQHQCILGRHAAWTTIWLQRSLPCISYMCQHLPGMSAACKDDFKSSTVIDVYLFFFAACWISLQETCTIHARLFTQLNVKSSLLSSVQQPSDVCIAVFPQVFVTLAKMERQSFAGYCI